MQMTNGNQDNKVGFSLREVATAMFRQKWMIISVFIVIFALVGVTTFLLPDQFESRTKILVKNSRADVIVSPEQNNNLTLTGEVSEAQVNSEIELIQSWDLLEAVVKKAGLAREFEKNGQEKMPVAIEKAIRQLEKKLSIAPVKKANIIAISYSAASPQQAVTVLKSLTELYLERHLQVHHVPGTDEFFKAQAVEYERRLKDAEFALLEFEVKNNIVSLNLQKEIGLKRVVDSETELQAASMGSIEVARRLETLNQQLQALEPRVTTQMKSLPHQYSIERLNTMKMELWHKRTQLLNRFQPEDRLVKEIDQQIADTVASLEKISKLQSVEQTSDINPLRQSVELELGRARTELITKQSRQESLTRLAQENRAKLSALESTTLKHSELERRVKELQDNYQLFAKKRDEALVTAALDKQKISNVSIAETPSTPSLPSSPNRKLNLLLGLFLAGFLGVSSAVGAEFLRDTVHTPRELEAISKYPVLATIPHQNLSERNHWESRMLGPGER